VHQDRTKSRGLDQPQARTLYHRKLKSSPPSIKNLSAVVICASQTGCAKSGRYTRAGHYLITVPRVPLTPLRTAGFFLFGSRTAWDRFLRCFWEGRGPDQIFSALQRAHCWLTSRIKAPKVINTAIRIPMTSEITGWRLGLTSFDLAPSCAAPMPNQKRSLSIDLYLATRRW